MDKTSQTAVPRVWLSLTVPIAISMTVASAAGAFGGSAYAKETPSWAAQGVGQDLANLFVVLPAFLAAGYLAFRGSARAALIWLGLVAYVLYSYVLYAFYTHFSALFLWYVATLGLSFYALVGGVLTANIDRWRALLRGNRKARAMSALLTTAGVLFALLWLSDISRALAQGTVPAAVAEVGLPVNPIHVLDLAFALPGVILTGILLWKRSVYGLLFAVPCTTFLSTMGIAIVAMMGVMRTRGVAVSPEPVVAIAATTVVSAYLTYAYLRDVRDRVAD